MLMAREGTTHYLNEMKSCYANYTDQRAEKGCEETAIAEFNSGLWAGFGVEYDKGHSWSYGWYFRTASKYLWIEIIAPPALIYGIFWG